MVGVLGGPASTRPQTQQVQDRLPVTATGICVTSRWLGPHTGIRRVVGDPGAALIGCLRVLLDLLTAAMPWG